MAEPHAKDACGKAERAPEKREIEKPCESCVRNLLNASREVREGREGNLVAKAVRPWTRGIGDPDRHDFSYREDIRGIGAIRG